MIMGVKDYVFDTLVQLFFHTMYAFMTSYIRSRLENILKSTNAVLFNPISVYLFSNIRVKTKNECTA